MGDLEKDRGSWQQSNPVPAVAAIWWLDQRKEDLSVFPSVFVILPFKFKNENKNILKSETMVFWLIPLSSATILKELLLYD